MPSLQTIKTEESGNQIIINYKHNNEILRFVCRPITTKAKTLATQKQPRRSRNAGLDLVVWHQVLFDYCVVSWNLDEECNALNKQDFFNEESPTLNLIGEAVINSLLEIAEEEKLEIEGN